MMGKRKYKKGGHILSIDEMMKQEFVYFGDRITHQGWFSSWQLRYAQRWIGENGRIFYAVRTVPEKIVCNKCGKRFADEDELKMLMEVRIAGYDVYAVEYNPHTFDEKCMSVFKGCPNCRTDAYLMDLEE